MMMMMMMMMMMEMMMLMKTYYCYSETARGYRASDAESLYARMHQT